MTELVLYRNRLVASILMRYESKCEKVNDSAVQALASGHVLSPDDAVNIVRSIRGDDIVAVSGFFQQSCCSFRDMILW